MDDIQRAIEILRKNKPTSDPRLCGKELCNACDVAMSAMRELQQYQATELTPHMIEILKEGDKQRYKLAVQRAIELDEYQAIGTPEECREAMERWQKRRPNDKEYCPICHTFLKDEDGVEGDYCPNCGQA